MTAPTVVLPEPYFSDGSATLYRADALAVLAALPDGSVDALITDPPYSSGGMFRGDRQQDVHTKYVASEQIRDSTGSGALEAFSGDNRDQRGYAFWLSLWLGEAMRIVKPGGVAALFTDWRQLPVTSDCLQGGGWIWRGIVPWHKPGGRPVQGRWANQCEYVVWGTNGPRDLLTLDGAALRGFYQCNAPRDREHMTQKPLSVMRELVKIAPKGGTVLDPFMGSGTTGIAAVLEGRRFVGCELTEHYAEVAQRRIVTAVQGYRDDGQQGVLGVEESA